MNKYLAVKSSILCSLISVTNLSGRETVLCKMNTDTDLLQLHCNTPLCFLACHDIEISV